MRTLNSTGGQLIVPRNILHDFGGFTIHPSEYDENTIAEMREYSYGQSWYLRFGNEHQCVGALLGYIYALPPARTYMLQWDESITYAYCPYVEHEDTGGMYQWSYAMTAQQLEGFLTEVSDKLKGLRLKCDAARTLFRNNVYDKLERAMLGDRFLSVDTREVSYYYHENPSEMC
jgi:hypothetical protein